MNGATLLPGGSDNVQGPPPMGSAMPIAAVYPSRQLLYVLKLTWNFAAGTSAITGTNNPVVLTPAAFSYNTGNYVPQPGASSSRLDALGDRLMNRLVYNHFGTYDTVRTYCARLRSIRMPPLSLLS